MSEKTEDTVFKRTLQHITAKFAHMNGHWKAYDHVIYYRECVRACGYRRFTNTTRAGKCSDTARKIAQNEEVTPIETYLCIQQTNTCKTYMRVENYNSSMHRAPVK